MATINPKKNAPYHGYGANKEIRRVVDTGRVVFGRKQSEKSILNAKAQLIITGRNAPKLLKERIIHKATIAGIPCYNFDGTGQELGKVCGKPFSVSVMAVEKPGKSSVLNLVKGSEVR